MRFEIQRQKLKMLNSKDKIGIKILALCTFGLVSLFIMMDYEHWLAEELIAPLIASFSFFVAGKLYGETKMPKNKLTKVDSKDHVV